MLIPCILWLSLLFFHSLIYFFSFFACLGIFVFFASFFFSSVRSFVSASVRSSAQHYWHFLLCSILVHLDIFSSILWMQQAPTYTTSHNNGSLLYSNTTYNIYFIFIHTRIVRELQVIAKAALEQTHKKKKKHTQNIHSQNGDRRMKSRKKSIIVIQIRQRWWRHRSHTHFCSAFHNRAYGGFFPFRSIPIRFCYSLLTSALDFYLYDFSGGMAAAATILR